MFTETSHQKSQKQTYTVFKIDPQQFQVLELWIWTIKGICLACLFFNYGNYSMKRAKDYKKVKFN